MNRLLFFIVIILAILSCERDRSPLNDSISDVGEIILVFKNSADEENSIPDTLKGSLKITKTMSIDKLEVRILDSNNSMVTSETLSPIEGRFTESFILKAQENLKVLCIGMNGDTIEYFGIDEDVDLQAGKTTVAVITGWNEPYIPDITGITPNPSTDGTYTVSWIQPINATTFVLQEADNQQFGGTVASYSTASLQISVSGRSAGTYYYRVQADNEYNIISGWSVIESAVVQNTHTISGTVTGADGVTVALSGDISETQTVNDGESYSFTVAEGGSYTVTPSKTGYSFTPANQTFNNVTSGYTRDFSGAQDSYAISGTVTGADGVIVIMGGDASDSKEVDDGGTYSFTVGGGGSYTVTPFKTGYLFNPASSSFTEITSNHTQDFTGISSVTYTLSGTVSGADGVTITLIGDASGSLVVNDRDSYSFTVAEGGNYIIIPSKSGFFFTPAVKTFDNMTADQTQNFAANVIIYTLSGTVSGADDVTITLSGDAAGSLVVNDGGSYSFNVAEGGNYTVTPSKTSYTFTPASQTFNNVTSNQTQNFDANVITYMYMISGTVSGTDGVTITLIGDASGSLVVNEGGSYSFTVAEGGNYTVTPSKTGYTFTPSSQSFTNVTSDQTQNFTASEEIQEPVTEITMVSIPEGSFRMGDISGDGDSDERPVHDVTISSFEMSKYEVTQEQYQSVIGSNPSYFNGTNLPVEQVSWYDAVKFCNALSVDAGLTPCYNESTWSCDFSADGFRLPTEAEWEYACRAGTETKYHTGNSESDLGRAGWYSSNSSSKTHPVGQKTANDFGLYDMHGNVREWCNDWYNSDYYDSSPSGDPTGPTSGYSRVDRGGGWGNYVGSYRSAYRGRVDPTGTHYNIGFRVVRGTITPGYTMTMAVNQSDWGTTSPAAGTHTYDEGTIVTITASPASGYRFVNWMGNVANTSSATTTVAMSDDRTVTANFEEIPVSTVVTMVSIPGGSFRMGDISGDGDGDELPVHDVAISSFEMGIYEVTQEQYEAIMGENSSNFSETNLLVQEVRWYDAVKFCNALSAEAGLTPCYNESTWECDFSADGFRLPTEAEWEYACRAGTETKYYTGNSDSDLGRAGWYLGHSDSKSHPVGQKTPNAFGLYDMHGNMWEWCNDWYDSDYYESSPSADPTGPSTGSYRVKRGGGWSSSAGNCRSADRSRYDPPFSYIFVGFRIVRGSFTPNYTITGTITGADGVTVTISGDTSGTKTVNDGDSYSFTVEHGSNYTVIPSKSGYSFTTSSKAFSNVTSNQTQDFTASIIVAADKIAFTSERDGNREIYVMDADGSNQTNLTNNSASDLHPSWSPDGSRIAFTSERDSNLEIYVMDANGSNQTRLTDNDEDFDLESSWSPDGSKIAFVSNGGFLEANYEDYEIWVMNADGSNETRLTYNSVGDHWPSWSPDGSRIAFESYRDGNRDIYVMNEDGSNQRNITNNSAGDINPSWSPDGSLIAFASDRDGNYEIYVMDADGSNQTMLTNNSDSDYLPSWSPDGSKIVFSSYRDGNSEIYVMDADGSNQTRLTDNSAWDSNPSWSPF